MQSITPRPTHSTASPRNIRDLALWCMVGSAALTLGGCVSQQTYDTARHEAHTHATELAQTQADIQRLEQQRDAAHLANQREERTLANLKNELTKIQSSYDQLHKTNQAKLVALEHNIAVLRGRHQAMLKEISETKRNEKRLEALTAQHEQSMATTQPGSEDHVTKVDGSPQESHMVAVITPHSLSGEGTPTSPVPAPAASEAPTPAVGMATTSAAPQPTSVLTAPTPPSAPAKVVQAPAPSPTPHTPTASATQDESWVSSVTGWFTSLFDWLWS